MMRALSDKDITHHHMPDYSVKLDEDDMVLFRSRGSVPCSAGSDNDVDVAALRQETYEDARIVAPGWDIYQLEREWREWITEPPRDADAAFVGFCRKWFERRGRP